MTDKLVCAEAHAALFQQWIQTRGGLAVWPSVNLSNPAASWTTPVLGPDGQPAGKPSWQAADQPARVITDPADVQVTTFREVKRFRVGLRVGSQGFTVKLTDGATRKVRAAVEKAGPGATYRFDYEKQEAVIEVPDGQTTLDQWSGKLP